MQQIASLSTLLQSKWIRIFSRPPTDENGTAPCPEGDKSNKVAFLSWLSSQLPVPARFDGKVLQTNGARVAEALLVGARCHTASNLSQRAINPQVASDVFRLGGVVVGGRGFLERGLKGTIKAYDFIVAARNRWPRQRAMLLTPPMASSLAFRTPTVPRLPQNPALDKSTYSALLRGNMPWFAADRGTPGRLSRLRLSLTFCLGWSTSDFISQQVSVSM